MERKISILMVDDEAEFRETTAKILMRKGFQTTMASSGEEAVELVRGSPFDVIILDIKMKGMDGHEALRQIKALTPEVKIIMLTGHGTIVSAKESLERGADDYLNKPCDIGILARKIRLLCSTSEKTGLHKEKLAKDIMIPVEEYTRVNISDSVKETIFNLMASYNNQISSSRVTSGMHRSVLVYKDQKKLVGVLSVRRIIESLRPAYLTASKPSMADSMQYSPMFWMGLFSSQAQKISLEPVENLMTNSLVIVDVEANLMEIVDLLAQHQTRRVIVTDQSMAVGIVREQELFLELVNAIS